jgi:hypothetical protein
MKFKLSNDIHKLYDKAEQKLTLYCEGNDDQLVVITDSASSFFNNLEINKEYSLHECIDVFCLEFQTFLKSDVEALFNEILETLEKSNFLTSSKK